MQPGETQMGLQWYCPLTHAGNGQGCVQPECCHWVKNGDEECTTLAIDLWIHSSKGPHNGLYTISFSSHGD